MLTVIIVLIALGILLWAAERYLPGAQPFKGIALFLIVLFGVIWLLAAAGIHFPLR